MIATIARGLETLYSDEEVRRNLIEKGLDRVKHFNWKTTVNKVANVLLKMDHVDEN